MEAIGSSSHVQAPGPGTAACGGTGGRASCLGDPANPEVFAGVWCPRSPPEQTCRGDAACGTRRGLGAAVPPSAPPQEKLASPGACWRQRLLAGARGGAAADRLCAGVQSSAGSAGWQRAQVAHVARSRLQLSFVCAKLNTKVFKSSCLISSCLQQAVDEHCCLELRRVLVAPSLRSGAVRAQASTAVGPHEDEDEMCSRVEPTASGHHEQRAEGPFTSLRLVRSVSFPPAQPPGWWPCPWLRVGLTPGWR